MLTNPIIEGFYPDPSIVRVDDDFYVVNSSFEYFPAIPIWHSRDLVNWRQIGNAVSRLEQQLDLSRVNPSGGVQAATIRHRDGTFYITSTRVGPEWPRSDQHFIVTATSAEGPWSECHFVDDAEGIDSSLFFDEDGKSYFLANRERQGAKDGVGAEIWMSEIDLVSFELIGPKQTLWDGSGGIYPEGPRLFKRNDWYYLLVAEGGTLHNHATTFARSREIWGPFEPTPRNPVLTHRNLGREYPIQNVGHADMVELQDGSWWGVCLGSRPSGGFYDGGNVRYSFGGYYRNLGRETFAFPITWPADELSPLFSPDTGRIEFQYESPNLPSWPQTDVDYSFTEVSLATKWVNIRDTNLNRFSLDSASSELSIRLGPTFEDCFIGVRQNSWNFSSSVCIDLNNLAMDDSAGLGMFIKKDHHISVQLAVDGSTLVVSFFSPDVEHEPIRLPMDTSKILVEVSGQDQDYEIALPELGIRQAFDGRQISCDLTDSHTGVMLGLFGLSKVDSTVAYSGFSYSTGSQQLI